VLGCGLGILVLVEGGISMAGNGLKLCWRTALLEKGCNLTFFVEGFGEGVLGVIVGGVLEGFP
jgi:hypothetical protein